MTDAEKALAYDDLLAKIVAGLKAQGWGQPGWRSWEWLRAEVTRLNTVRDLDLAELERVRAALAACEAKLPPEPEPEPERWRTVKRLVKPSDWNSRLIQGFKGATITEAVIPGTDLPATRFWIPGAQSVGGSSRVEVQSYFGEEGMICAYEFGLYLPRRTVLSRTADKENLIHQGHGNEQGGFTSGTSIDEETERVKVKVKGGDEKSTAGSHRYEYESEFVFGQIERDVLHVVRHEVFWHRDHGYYRARLDDGEWMGVSDVPTWPVGQLAEGPTEHIMVRNGWYPSQGRSYGDMELFTTPMIFEEAV